MYLIQSKNIKDYKPILEGLIDDFDYVYYADILKWCGIIDNDPGSKGRYCQVWLMVRNTKVIGICGLYADRPKYKHNLWLSWFGILPEYRGLGFAAKTLSLLEEHAKSIGCKRILSYVDKNGTALNCYKKCGYTVYGRVKKYLQEWPESMQEFECHQDYIIFKDLS